MDEDLELLERPKNTMNVVSDSASTHHLLSSPNFGKPGRKHSLTLIDFLTVILSLLGLGAAILSVCYSPLAARLGQTYQFVFLGFLLSIMGFGLKRQAQLLLLTVEALHRTSTLQNYDAILRNDNFAPLVGKALRFNLLLLFILPLGLSASYKTFSNGKTTLSLSPASGNNYDLVGPVGNFSWIGVALMANATLPIQANIKNFDQTPLPFPSFHGFNMYVVSENTTAMLDSPNQAYFASIQAILEARKSASKDLNEEVEISAQVGATVFSVNKSSIAPGDQRAYWESVYTQYDFFSPVSNDAGSWVGLVNGWADLSFVAVSAWQGDNSSVGFESNAVGYDVRRGRCDATWRIKRGGISLIDASDCVVTPITEFLTNNILALDNFYLPSLLEYIGYSGTPKSLWTSVVAAMVWSRCATTLDSNTRGSSVLYYSTTDTRTWTMQTVQQSWVLYLVLGLQPFLIVVMLLARVFLFSSPVTEGFGIVTLLAGLSTKSASVLRGATLTGKLSRAVKVQIMVVPNGDRDSYEDEHKGVPVDHIEYVLNGDGRNSVVARGKTYG